MTLEIRWPTQWWANGEVRGFIYFTWWLDGGCLQLQSPVPRLFINRPAIDFSITPSQNLRIAGSYSSPNKQNGWDTNVFDHTSLPLHAPQPIGAHFNAITFSTCFGNSRTTISHRVSLHKSRLL